VKRQASLVKRQASLVKRQASLVKRQASLVKRQASLVKRQASLVKRQASLVKRQASLVKRQASLAKRQASLAKRQASLVKRHSLIYLSRVLTNLNHLSPVPSPQERGVLLPPLWGGLGRGVCPGLQALRALTQGYRHTTPSALLLSPAGHLSFLSRKALLSSEGHFIARKRIYQSFTQRTE
jgi:receptor tyrosine-protein kinase erbB-2